MIRIPRWAGAARQRLPSVCCAAAFVACGGLLLAFSCGRPARTIASGGGDHRKVDELVEVAGDARFTEPWLSAFPEYRRCGSAPEAVDAPSERTGTAGGYGGSGTWRRGDCPDRPPLQVRRLSAWAREQERTPELDVAGPGEATDRLHARGLWSLLFPRRRADAVTFLEAARDREPGRWQVHNDLAAAAYLHALDGDPIDLLLALTEVDAAIAAAPEALPPRFNGALILERIGLSSDAEQAWRTLLALDPPAGWREEAAQRLARLTRREPDSDAVADALRKALDSGNDGVLDHLVATHPQDAWYYGKEQVLRRWAEAQVQERQQAAERNDDALRRLGAALARGTGEAFLLDLADRAAELPRADRRRFAAAVSSFLDGESLFDARDLPAAEAALDEAARQAQGIASPLDAWIASSRLLCDYMSGKIGVEAALEHLRAEVDGGRDPILEGNLLWTAGLTRTDSGRFSAGRRLYRRAIERFAAAGLSGEVAILRVLLSDIELQLGMVDEAWSEVLAAASASDAMRNPRHRWTLWDEAARIATWTGYDRAALRFQDAAVLAAGQARSTSTRSSAFASRARARIRLGNLAGARKDLDQARRWSRQIKSPTIRPRVEASILLAQNRAEGDDHAAEKIDRLDQAIDHYRQIGATVLIPELLLERARLLAGTKDQAAAEKSLLAGLAAMGDEAERLTTPEERVSFSATARGAVDALLHLALGPDGERDRVPLLTDLARDPLSGAAAALAPDVPRALRLGAGEAFLSVTVLTDRFVVWTARGDRLAIASEPVDARELRRRLRAIADKPTRDDLGWFYDRMIRPLGATLAGTDRLFVALDRGLYLVPAAALFDRERDRYLVEETAVSIVPSAARFAARAAEPHSAPTRLALVAAPGGGDLPRLHEVDDEATDLAGLYPSVLGLGGPASAGALADVACHADVVHVAAHAVSNSIDPGLSFLSTSPEPVYARDLRTLDLHGVQTVVLSACDTATTSPQDSSGALSLASAFLEAGASWVVGSTGPIDDGAARRFVERLHRELRTGASPDRALRATQSHFARSGELPLREWAAFEAFTG